MLHKWFIERIESNLLTWLFKRWIQKEYDVELMEFTRCMIYEREKNVKSMFNSLEKKPTIGFKQPECVDNKRE
jgi:hypothetical protein